MYEDDQYKWLYLTSYMALFASMFAFYRRHYVISFFQFLIYMTSINYWILPDYSWRRYADMAVVKSYVLYQTYLAYNAEYAAVYYTIFLLGLSFYPTGTYLYGHGYTWLSIYSHMALHIMAALGSCVLYAGAIPRANSLLV